MIRRVGSAVGPTTFFKCVKWSPDGSIAVSSNNDRSFRAIQYSSLFNSTEATNEGNEHELQNPVLITAPEPVNDFCFHPASTVECGYILGSVRDHPIHLWDTATGQAHCKYTALDHMEQIATPISACFNLDGSKIYCGFYNHIQVFDTERPGRDSERISITKTRKSRDGQKGLISTLCFNPDHSGLFAAGSFSGSLGLYDSCTNKMLYTLNKLGGVTQAKFSPDGCFLFAASRKRKEIVCWDIRNTGEIVYTLERPATTNQRLYFDIDPWGQTLVSGDQDGYLNAWDITQSEGDRLLWRYPAHSDTCSSVSFHPFEPLIASSSGQRHFETLDDATDDGGVGFAAMDGDHTDDNSVRVWQYHTQTIVGMDAQGQEVGIDNNNIDKT
ncbi:WD40-repeat-containing domain protein [Cladochytrium replicatum]|nr:WD40-repeat-containing domain protein [Cladochytrium replicatum]